MDKVTEDAIDEDELVDEIVDVELVNVEVGTGELVLIGMDDEDAAAVVDELEKIVDVTADDVVKVLGSVLDVDGVEVIDIVVGSEDAAVEVGGDVENEVVDDAGLVEATIVDVESVFELLFSGELHGLDGVDEVV